MRAVPTCATKLVVQRTLALCQGLRAREPFHIRHAIGGRDLQFINDVARDAIILTSTVKEVDHCLVGYAECAGRSPLRKHAFQFRPAGRPRIPWTEIQESANCAPAYLMGGSGRTFAGRAMAVLQNGASVRQNRNAAPRDLRLCATPYGD